MKNFTVGAFVVGAVVSNAIWQRTDSGAALVVSAIFSVIAILVMVIPFEDTKVKIQQIRRK